MKREKKQWGRGAKVKMEVWQSAALSLSAFHENMFVFNKCYHHRCKNRKNELFRFKELGLSCKLILPAENSILTRSHLYQI